MPRGERIGEAYISIYGDGSSVARDVGKSLDDSDKEFKKKGDEHGKLYGDAFSEEFDQRLEGIKDHLTDELTLGSGDIDRIQRTLDSGIFDHLEEELRGRGFGTRLATQIRDDFQKEFEGGGRLELFDEKDIKADGEVVGKELGNILDNLASRTVAANRKIRADDEAKDRARVASAAKAAAAIAALDRDRVNRSRQTNRQELADFDRLFKSMEKQAQKAVGGNDELRKSIDNVADAVERLTSGEDLSARHRKSTLATITGLRERLGELEDGTKDGGKAFRGATKDLDGFERRVRNANPALRGITRGIGELSDLAGRAFGKGSRNNFVNFFGSLTGNLLNVTSVIPRVLEGVAGLVSDLRSAGSAFTEAGGGAQGMAAAMSKLFPLLIEVGTGVAALGVAAAAVVFIVGPLVSILSLLAGTVVALAASISFALIGGLSALIGLLAPIGAAVGVLALGFVGLDKATKKLVKENLAPITKELRGLGAEARKGLFKNLAQDSKEFAVGISVLRPLVRKVAEAIGESLGDAFAQANSQGFRDFVATMTDFLPGAVTQLGRIFGQTFEGIAGVFVALIPLTNRFLRFLDRITASFAKFTNGAEGQSKLEDFFKRTGDSARDLGDLLGSLGGLISELFAGSDFAGVNAGNNLIESLTTNIRNFTKFLKANPDSLKKWFGDSVSFAKQVGDVVVGIGKLFDVLDSPAARKIATGLFQGIEKSLPVVAEGFGIVDDALRFLAATSAFFTPLFHLVAASFDLAAAPVRLLASLIRGDLTGALRAILLPVADALDAIGSLGGLLGKIPGVPDHLGQSAHDAADRIRDLGKSADELVTHKPKVDTSSVDKAAKSTRDAKSDAEEMYNFFGSRGAPEVPLSDKQIKAVNETMKKSASLIGTLSGLTAKPGADKTPFDKMTVSQQKVINLQRQAMGLPQLKIKVDKSPFDLLLDAINKAISAAAKLDGTKIHVNTIYKTTGNPNGSTGAQPTAIGGIFDYAQTRLIAEAGPEAVVPLNRPLSQVDPAVRMLSAIAQGKALPTANASDKPTVDASGWTIVSNSDDPETVAREVVNHIAAAAF